MQHKCTMRFYALFFLLFLGGKGINAQTWQDSLAMQYRNQWFKEEIEYESFMSEFETCQSGYAAKRNANFTGVSSPVLKSKNTETFIQKMYPNPSNRNVTLEPVTHLSDIKIQVASLEGVVLEQRTVKDGETEVQLNFPKLKPGSYLITVNASQGSYSKVWVV